MRSYIANIDNGLYSYRISACNLKEAREKAHRLAYYRVNSIMRDAGRYERGCRRE